MRRRVLKGIAALALIIVIAAATIYLLARRSLPVVNGTISVAGLSAPVDIVRDADAIPHIFAATKADAFFGLGYVHAQDRLWQMEFQRRIGHGRLSEIFGRATLAQDRFLRTVGFGRAAAAAWASAPEPAKAQLNAYVAGVNAFISTHHGTSLPPEFTLLGFEPEPFSGVDVVVWVKMMAWDLSSNYLFEMVRHDLAASVGPDRARELMPPYAANGLNIAPWSATAPANLAAAFRQTFSGHPGVRDFLNGAGSEGIGSNNWVVDGSMTASGKPLLANDPHLGTRLPSTWYLAQMSSGDFDVVGATLPGTPAVVLGRNKYIAWGATNVAADVEDLYREKLDETGRFSEFKGAQEPIQIIPETILVKGEAPVHLDVRVTRHGPLVSDAINASAADAPAATRRTQLEPLAFRWTALDPDDSTITAVLHMNEAKNWADFTGALRDFVVPSQNFVFADVDGHIGYYAPGRVPVRASGNGEAPVEGWTGDAEWTAWVPFDSLPHLFDPPTHFIVTANDRPVPDAYPYMLGVDWPEPYRAQRITDLLKAKGGGLKPDDFAAIQHDTVSLHARTLLPLLVSHARPQDARDRDALEIVRKWDGDARGDSAGAAIFEAWFLRLAPSLVGDELGPVLTESYEDRFSSITRFVINTLNAPNSPWCDDVRTPAKESCDDTITAALHGGVLELTRQMGGDLSRWRWDTVHRAIFPHGVFDSVPMLRPLFSRSMPASGDWSTVDVGPVETNRPYEQRQVPGYREIIDLSPANDSRFLSDIGQSGHFLSPHYDDFLADWKAVRPHPMKMDRAEIEKNTIGTLTLKP